MKRVLAYVACLSCSHLAQAQSQQLALDIRGTSLQDLMNLKISSLSRKQEDLNTAPAAVHVITNDQIKRMGVTHIAEALRYAPGVEVARLGANRWAISIRGFNSANANKLLVMIDGRSIYTPLYSGVLWEEKDVLLEDVDRIEVIHGPGGTLWGANAVNGVINIITKDAKDTLGGFGKVGLGLEERHFAAARYGWQLGDDTYARVYGKFTRRDDSAIEDRPDDHSEMQQFGFRMDRHSAEQGNLTLQGDLYQGEFGPDQHDLLNPGQEYNGGNLLLSWNYWQTRERNHEFLAYHDVTDQETGELVSQRGQLADQRKIWNFDYRLLQRWRSHELVGGVGYRYLSDDVQGPPQARLDPQKRTDELYSAFLQDDIAFLNDRLHLTLGTKYELNDYSNEEWQPSVRTSYALSDSSLVWVAWSRAVRIPTRLEHDAVVSDPGTGQVVLDADGHLDPEYTDFYELGWRKSWAQTWQLDIAGYLGEYRDLMTTVRSPLDRALYTLGNEISGDITGVEASISLQAASNWLLRLNYSHADLDITSEPGNLEPRRATNLESSSPNDMVKLMSLWDISPHWQLNTYLRYVDELPARDAPSYWAGDLSVVWRPLEQTTVQLVGRHLGHSKIDEWGPDTNAVEPDWALYLTQEF